MNSKVTHSIVIKMAVALMGATVFLVKVPLAQACNMYVVSFISIGAGIDYDTAQEFEKFLGNEYPDLNYEANSAGIEGEIDYCFDLSNLSSEQQTAFREESNQILEKSKLVQISEPEECPQKMERPGSS